MKREREKDWRALQAAALFNKKTEKNNNNNNNNNNPMECIIALQTTQNSISFNSILQHSHFAKNKSSWCCCNANKPINYNRFNPPPLKNKKKSNQDQKQLEIVCCVFYVSRSNAEMRK